MAFSKPRLTFKINLRLEKLGVRVASILTVLLGLTNLASAVRPALMNRLTLIQPFIPLAIRHGSRITSALAGFALLLLANSLWRRKRVAWFFTIVLLVVTFVSHLIKGLDFEESSLSLGLLILLVILRNSFHAESDRPSVKQGLYVLGIAFGFTLAYGIIGFYLLDRHFHIQYKLLEAVRQTILMFTFNNPGVIPIIGFGRYFIYSIYVIGLTTISFALLMLIRPVLVRQPATREERQRAERIVRIYGRTALARAALFEDKSFWFGPGETIIAYASRGRGAIALGDPMGPSDQVANAINGFRDFCGHKDWTPAFASTLPDYLEHYRAAGFNAICVGYEAIVDLANFGLAGSRNKDTRYTVNRMEREGFRVVVYQPPLDNGLLRSLREISNAWLTLRKGGEMHFSDGWFDDDYIRSSAVSVVHTADGTPIAFVNLVPEYAKNELAIDLMRHFLHTEHEVMEFLFAKTLLWAKDAGYATFSLGLSAIVGVGEKPDDPRIEKALHTVAEYRARFYNFKGLHTFKEKFHPGWEPRYLVYPGPANLPLIMNVLLRVHTDNNTRKFLPARVLALVGITPGKDRRQPIALDEPLTN